MTHFDRRFEFITVINILNKINFQIFTMRKKNNGF